MNHRDHFPFASPRLALKPLLLLALLLVGAQTLAVIHKLSHGHSPDHSHGHAPCELCLLANNLTPALPALPALPQAVMQVCARTVSPSPRIASRLPEFRHGHDPPSLPASINI